MPDFDRMSTKEFLEFAIEKIDSLTAAQLRLILTDIFLQTPPSKRQELLDMLTPHEAEAEEEEVVKQNALLDEIEAFIDEFEGATEEDAIEYYYDLHWDDEDATGPYEGYVDEMISLLDRASTVFDDGDLETAKEAYNRLFAVFDIEDDYGGGIKLENIESSIMKKVIARYLRCVYETASLEDRPQLLFKEINCVLPMVSDRKIGLEDMIQVSARPLPDEGQFLDDWIALVRGKYDKMSDYLLREAIGLSKGTMGLKELALSEGKDHPRAFLDWIAALMEEGKYSDVVAAVEQARQSITPDTPIRAAIAEHLKEAAGYLNDEKLASTAIWEMFYARPNLSHLMDVWESASDGSQRVKLMQRASERIKEYLAQNRPIASYYSDTDAVERYVYVRQTPLVHAYLLAGNWESTCMAALEQDEIERGNFDNSQRLAVACLLGLVTGKMPQDVPKNLSLLWDTVLENSVGYGGSDEIISRLKSVYGEMFPDASLGQQEESLLNWCLYSAKKQVTFIVQNKKRKDYRIAATLITACAEVLNIRGDVQESQAIIAEIRSQFPRHRAFQAELRDAAARR